jgi:hypothetical protein
VRVTVGPCPVLAPMWASDTMRLRLFPLAMALTGLAGAAAAQTPLTADEFEAHVTGKTVTYSQLDQMFGIEQYLAGRKVRWSVAPGTCQYGSWYPEDENICFVYEYDDVPHCWTFWLEGGALVARSALGQPGDELHEAARSDTPLGCPGPDVGA